MCYVCDEQEEQEARARAGRRTCSFCYFNASPDLTTADGRPVCTRCHSMLVSCAGDRCNHSQGVSTAMYSHIGEGRRKYYCPPCYSNLFRWCGRCEEYRKRAEFTTGHGNNCDSCVNSSRPCPTCPADADPPGRLWDDAWYTYTGPDGEECCAECYDSARRCDSIRDYSYRPDPHFWGDGDLFFGMEVEIASNEFAQKAMAIAAEHYAGDAGEDLFYLKEDGSFENGFELVTHPMAYEWAKNHFPWDMFRAIQESGGFTHEGTGIHVHVSRKGFKSASHIFKWLTFFYKNKSDITRLARRNSDEWASFDREDRDLTAVAKGSKSGHRYSAINVQNDATFEVRVFRSSTDAEEVRATLELVAASVEYVRYLTIPEIRNGGWTWDKFMEWITSQDEYTALVSQNQKTIGRRR